MATGTRTSSTARMRLGALALFATILTLATAFFFVTQRQSHQLRGSDLQGAAAPGFQLMTADGNSVALRDFRGKVVVLTFLYTHCPNECPLIAENLRAAAAQMPGSMNQVAFVAVSVDPRNDTPGAVSIFLRQHRVSNFLTYLVGSEAQLKPVWSAYYIYAQQDPSNPNLVGHSGRVILIDRAGKQRVNLDSDFSPGDLVYDVQALLAE